MNKSRKIEITPKRLVLFLISVLLVLTSIAGLIYHTVFYTKSEDVVPTNLQKTTSQENIKYDVVEKLIFTEKVEKALKVNFAVADSESKFSSVLLEAMSNAGIPSDKMQLVGDYFTSIMKYLRDQGVKVAEDYSEKALAVWKDQISADISNKVKGFFAATGLTKVEFGKFIYWLMHDNSGSDLYTDTLEKMGVDAFVTLTVNTISALSGLNALKEGDASAAEARSFQSLCYSLGESYMSIVDKIGPSGVETLLGLTYSISFDAEEIPETDRAVYNATISALNNKIGVLLDTFGYIMKNTDALTFELLAQTFNDSSDEENVMAMSSLAKSIKKGATVFYGYAETSGISDRTAVCDKYSGLVSELSRFVDNFYGTETPSDYVAIAESTKETIAAGFAAIDKLADLSPEDLEDAATMPEYIAAAEDLKAMGTTFMDGLNECILVVGVNLVMKIRNLEQYLDSGILNSSLYGITNSVE